MSPISERGTRLGIAANSLKYRLGDIVHVALLDSKRWPAMLIVTSRRFGFGELTGRPSIDGISK